MVGARVASVEVGVELLSGASGVCSRVVYGQNEQCSYGQTGKCETFHICKRQLASLSLY